MRHLVRLDSGTVVYLLGWGEKDAPAPGTRIGQRDGYWVETTPRESYEVTGTYLGPGRVCPECRGTGIEPKGERP